MLHTTGFDLALFVPIQSRCLLDVVFRTEGQWLSLSCLLAFLPSLFCMCNPLAPILVEKRDGRQHVRLLGFRRRCFRSGNLQRHGGNSSFRGSCTGTQKDNTCPDNSQGLMDRTGSSSASSAVRWLHLVLVLLPFLPSGRPRQPGLRDSCGAGFRRSRTTGTLGGPRRWHQQTAGSLTANLVTADSLTVTLQVQDEPGRTPSARRPVRPRSSTPTPVPSRAAHRPGTRRTPATDLHAVEGQRP